jgi:ABC-type nitrate/sulfonate/bicarbonate transport system substrate-binding protein
VRSALIAALAAALITGCGGVAGGDRPDEDATLLLDSRPGAVHAGILLARERGYDEAEGVRLELDGPGGAVAKLRDGRADFAILDVRALARARAGGADLVGVYAVLQRPRGPVLCVTRTTLEDREPLVRAAVRALQRGSIQAQVEPDSAVAAVQAAAPRADREALAQQLDAVSPAFTSGARAPGELRRELLSRTGIDVERAFDYGQVGPVRNP